MKKILLILGCLCLFGTAVRADQWVDNRAATEQGRVEVVNTIWKDLCARGIVQRWGWVELVYRTETCGSYFSPSDCPDAHFDLSYVHKEWKEYCRITSTRCPDAHMCTCISQVECFTPEEYRERFDEEPPAYTSERRRTFREDPEYDGMAHCIEGSVSSHEGWNDEESTQCDRTITVTAAPFDRGSYDMDPTGTILRHGQWRNPPAYDPHHLYYRYATSLVEAVTYILLHEYGHYLGLLSEGSAGEYARSMIVELRKAKLGRSFAIRHIDAAEYTHQCEAGIDSQVTLPYNGQAPPSNDMPPGSIRN